MVFDENEEVVSISKFFNHLVELIPAKFYRSEDDGRVDLKYMKKAERDAAKQEIKAKHKQNKRVKLGSVGSENGSDGTEEAVPDSTSQAATGTTEAQPKHAPLLNISSACNLSRDELQEKLQQKIQSMRQQRHHVEKQEAVKKAKDWKQKTLEQNVKRKQQQQDQQKKKDKEPMAKRKANGEPESVPKSKRLEKTQQEPEQEQGGTAAANFSFPRIEMDMGIGSRAGGKGGTKKLNKEQLLKIAEAKQKEKAQPGGGSSDEKSKDTWKSALLRAKGERVLDDPKLLRKSLKKESKIKEKNQKAWQERVTHQKDIMAAKQNKRKDNLQKRQDGRLDKKKDKREKKLLRAGSGGGGGGGEGKVQRAGFEGRRETFIGDKKH